MNNLTELFGKKVFGDAEMKTRLSPETYRSLRNTITKGEKLDLSVANAVASAMKDWAIENGATHFTHWFQPLTGITAEKHDSFISVRRDGSMITEFSGKELIKGEPDASSFPSGGLRATFEARGYTAWDPTSFAFLKGHTLCIPTAFCSFGGAALDQKTPLLRSMEAINLQSLRILRLFGNDTVRHVSPEVGAEQEYFLIDRSVYESREDLVITGRTLFGAKPPKGQEMNDHYFGIINTRVEEFMMDLDQQLWELGVPAKTEHNETAPSQHELAPVYTTANISTDQNQITMEMMHKIAKKHNLVCLLHEKPFSGVNGSGKHNNWSLATDTGVNLLSPGDTPHDNAQFLLFFCAVIKAVDEYQDLLRLSVATAGNDHRLGADEAPPAVISVFIGDELSAVLDAIENEAPYSACEKKTLRLGVDVLPKIARDTTDRNRTSPFAFTGNKFEFRMVGSSNSIACPNIMLNAAVASELKAYADLLEQAEDFENTLHELIRDTIRDHKRILFNGNGYEQAWIDEAVNVRHLSNYKTTADCMPHLMDEANVRMLTEQNVFTRDELKARCEIMLDNYCKTNTIEANTMIDMVRKDILPAVSEYSRVLAEGIAAKQVLNRNIPCQYEASLTEKLSGLSDEIYSKTSLLSEALEQISSLSDAEQKAYAVRDRVIPLSEEIRKSCDEAESLVSEKYWPFPTYSKLLYSVN